MNNIMKHTALQFPPFKGGLGKVLLLLLLFLPMLLHAQESAYLDAIRIDNYFQALRILIHAVIQCDRALSEN